jgi:hypothetical protein
MNQEDVRKIVLDYADDPNLSAFLLDVVGFRKTAFTGTALSKRYLDELRKVLELDTTMNARSQVVDILDSRPLLRSGDVMMGCFKLYVWAENWMKEHGRKFDPKRDIRRFRDSEENLFAALGHSSHSSRHSSRRSSRRNSSDSDGPEALL